VSDTPFKVSLNGKFVLRSEASVGVDTVAFKYAAMVLKEYEPIGVTNGASSSFFVSRTWASSGKLCPSHGNGDGATH
jgi:hypothetical protein